MRIITWNCNMAFRKKWEHLLNHQPDILIIQECEHPSKFKESEEIPNINEFLWIGENQNKGVGIISFNNYRVSLADYYSQEFQYVIPVNVSGDLDATLFAIWAMPHKIKSKGYVGQVWRAIQHYKEHLVDDTILVGDFNSNQQWDSDRKNGNHTDVVEFLSKFEIESLYHSLKNEGHGKEQEPTLYLLKNLLKPYHMDYCFVSSSLINKKTNLQVGRYNGWIPYSDHMPVIIDHLGYS